MCTADLKSELVNIGISTGAAEIVLNSWATSTKKQYDLSLRKWLKFCRRDSADPFDPKMESILNFLHKCNSLGVGVSVLNTHGAALSSFFSCSDPSKQEIFASKLLARFMKGIFREKAASTSRSGIWDVQKVLDHIDS